MEFCDICSNMLYITRDKEDNKMIKYCKHCSFKKKEETNKAIKVCETIYSEDDLLYNQYINKYLRYDPTLRRIKDDTIICPNDKCSNTTGEQRVLYIKYHPTNMKYLYVCDFCGHIWR